MIMLNNAGREEKTGIGMTARSKQRFSHAPAAFIVKGEDQPSKRRPRRFGRM
jgi:hypothetical protein